MNPTLAEVYDGWNGYQASLVRAVAPLSGDQLSWRPVPHRRSVGELARHISLGRINWFSRMPAPGIAQAVARVPRWATDGDGVRHVVEEAVPITSAADLGSWLVTSWEPVRRVLEEWTVENLSLTYRHRFRGTDYDVSRQWTIWRIMAHDIHHGGQIAMMLATQGVRTVELGLLGGHIVEPPKAGGASEDPHRAIPGETTA